MRRPLLLAALLLAGCPDDPAPAVEATPEPTPQATPAPRPTPTPAPVTEATPFEAPTITALPAPESIPDTPAGLRNGAWAPELARTDLITGQPFALSQHVGPKADPEQPTKVAVVGMVASWCGPCAASLPTLKALEEEHNGALEVVLVATDATPEGRKAEADKVAAAGLNAVVLDPTPEDLQAWMGRKRNVPHFYIVNKVGEVLVQDRGFGNKVKKVLPGQIGYAMRHPEYVDRSRRR